MTLKNYFLILCNTIFNHNQAVYTADVGMAGLLMFDDAHQATLALRRAVCFLWYNSRVSEIVAECRPDAFIDGSDRYPSVWMGPEDPFAVVVYRAKDWPLKPLRDDSSSSMMTFYEDDLPRPNVYHGVGRRQVTLPLNKLIQESPEWVQKYATVTYDLIELAADLS